MRDITANAIAAGYTGLFQLERAVVAEDLEIWREMIGQVAKIPMRVRLYGTATWWYVRDVLDDVDPPVVVIVRRDIDAVVGDLIGMHIGQIGN